MKIPHQVRFPFLLMFLGAIAAQGGQPGGVMAVVPSLIDPERRTEWESALQLTGQRFVIFLYRNAAAVRAEAKFVNSGPTPLELNIGIPSTGFRSTDDEGFTWTSNGLLDVRLLVGGERTLPEVHRDGDLEWIVARAVFPPRTEVLVTSTFWVQSSLEDYDIVQGGDTLPIPDGERALLVDLADASIWKDVISSVDIAVVLKQGMDASDSLFEAVPETYEGSDSTLTWSMRDVEPSPQDNIVLRYNSRIGGAGTPVETMATLSRRMVRNAYDELLEYARR